MSQNQKHPNADWPFWKILGAAFIGLGVFGLLVAFLPPFSPLSVTIGIGSIIVGTGVAIWNWRSFNWTSRFGASLIWSLQVLMIGIRAWLEVYPRIWLLPILVCYCLAWILPGFAPVFSKLFWREQTAPQTRLGRIILGMFISLAPVAGAVGASIGMYTARFSGISGTYLIIGPGFLILAIGMAFAFSYQILPYTPWTQSENKGDQ
jgi:hypothetical protein